MNGRHTDSRTKSFKISHLSPARRLLCRTGMTTLAPKLNALATLVVAVALAPLHALDPAAVGAPLQLLRWLLLALVLAVAPGGRIGPLEVPGVGPEVHRVLQETRAVLERQVADMRQAAAAAIERFRR